uniref:Uncharacterized protein n=1 Tax=viral metagenome TaxID=1070528 RepID=A0A6C0E999_9ZZZZ
MATFEETKNKLIEYHENPLFVYMKVGQCIVVMKKLKCTITNEDRTDVIDKNHARFNANQLYIEKIIDVRTLKELSVLDSPNLSYIVGKDAYVRLGNGGINYYLSLEPAYYLNAEIINGEYKEWWNNGQIKLYCHYVNGKEDGSYAQWYSNGNLKSQANYVNRTLNGKYTSYYENGNKEMESFYVDGLETGVTHEWSADGDKWIISGSKICLKVFKQGNTQYL